MSKRNYIMFVFSSICNGAALLILSVCLYMLTFSIITKQHISTTVILLLFGLVACVVLLYLSRIPIIGCTYTDIKETTPISPKMHRARVWFYEGLSLCLGAFILCLLGTSSLSENIASDGKVYVVESGMIDNTTFLDILPPIMTDEIYASALVLEDAVMLQENIDSEEALSELEESAALYKDVKASRNGKLCVITFMTILWGFCFTVLRLRSNYVDALKEVGKVNGNN